MSGCVWEGAGLHPDKSALSVKKKLELAMTAEIVVD